MSAKRESWGVATAEPHLPSNEVHVWLADLTLPFEQMEGYWQILSEAERRRAERYYFEEDRKHFVAARGHLRSVLGRYLNVEPSQVQFSVSGTGKPVLMREFDHDQLRFNLSHSHGLAALAVTCGRRIGVDLERIRPGPAEAGIAERFFCAREAATLQALPSERKRDAFFTCWTRKEAFLKASGLGLSLPLSHFEVALALEEPAALLWVARDSSEASRWALKDLPAIPGYKAAIAVEGHDWRLRCWRWLR